MCVCVCVCIATSVSKSSFSFYLFPFTIFDFPLSGCHYYNTKVSALFAVQCSSVSQLLSVLTNHLIIKKLFLCTLHAPSSVFMADKIEFSLWARHRRSPLPWNRIAANYNHKIGRPPYKPLHAPFLLQPTPIVCIAKTYNPLPRSE